MMPGTDGWNVLGYLKEDPELALIPVVMVSMVDDKSKGHAPGAVNFIGKLLERAK